MGASGFMELRKGVYPKAAQHVHAREGSQGDKVLASRHSQHSFIRYSAQGSLDYM